MDIRTTLRQGIAQLRAAGVSSYTLAAELLLLHTMNRDRAWLYAHPEEVLNQATTEAYSGLIARRALGEPTQYLTGKQEFWSLDFEVNSDVLIPRPETEHVIEVALDRLAVRELRGGRPQKTNGEGLVIVDVGTGSGCIAVALARELPGATIYATDISPKALSVAHRNAVRHNVSERIRFLHSNLLDAFRGQQRVLDLVASNPPYIGLREKPGLDREVRDYEPPAALYGGEEGYELYAGLVGQAANHLKPEGVLVLELGYKTAPAVQPLLDTPDWNRASVTNDLAGIPRIVAAERS